MNHNNIKFLLNDKVIALIEAKAQSANLEQSEAPPFPLLAPTKF
jgi:hypothetical protein